MNEKELREIEIRAAEATLGPWRAEFGSEVKSGRDVIAYIHPRVGGWADTLFTAAARSDIPILCAEVRRLQKVINDAQGREREIMVMMGESLSLENAVAIVPDFT